MNAAIIGAVATAAVAIIHATASATCQIIRAWKQPITSSGKPPVPIPPTPAPKGPTP